MSCFLLCGKYFANNDFIFLDFCWPQPDMGIWYLQQRFYRHLHRIRFATKAFLLGRLSHVEMWQHIVRLPGAQGLGRPTWYRFGYQRHQKQMKSMCNHLWACQQPQWALQAESHGLRKFNVDQETRTKATTDLVMFSTFSIPTILSEGPLFWAILLVAWGLFLMACECHSCSIGAFAGNGARAAMTGQQYANRWHQFKYPINHH